MYAAAEHMEQLPACCMLHIAYTPECEHEPHETATAKLHLCKTQNTSPIHSWPQKTGFARWFPVSLPHYFLQYFKACRAGLHLMQKAWCLSAPCVGMPCSTATAPVLLLTTSVALPSSGRSDPSPPLMLLQVVLKVGLSSLTAGVFKDV